MTRSEHSTKPLWLLHNLPITDLPKKIYTKSYGIMFSNDHKQN